MANKLDSTEIDAALLQIPGWSLDAKAEALTCSLKFESFNSAFAFITAVALEAEKMDHHPEWSNNYNRVEILLTTHSANGITDLDFELARLINKKIKNMDFKCLIL